MTPEQLRAEDFAHYPAAGRNFAVESLSLLRRLPIAICPSFLEQIQTLDTSFPAERDTLRRQLDALAALPPEEFRALMAPLAEMPIPPELQKSDWVRAPDAFIPNLTAWLWAGGHIDRFRTAVQTLFAAIPDQRPSPHRLTLVVIGRDAAVGATPRLEKLRPRGVLLTALASEQMTEQIFQAFAHHAQASSQAYAHWYVDGGDPWVQDLAGIPGAVSVSYPKLDGLRKGTLAHMEQMTQTAGAGAEAMRARLAGISAHSLDAASVTRDPVLARFYTELFTLSSGPQIFSTSFVQWTGRELARRAQPQTLLLRYAPRQRYQPFNQLLLTTNPASMDPEGSLRDAEIGAYYAWIEMDRITSPGKGTFLAWIEGTSQAVIIGSQASRGTRCDTPLHLKNALEDFG
ncbi:MAG TPA: hypothetical protein VHX37_12255 [Acidobacteriaceae bacterium]|jgi:hypothetical protein|nr:hypothetical protein [Acidobacteriaceae bacterium]